MTNRWIRLLLALLAIAAASAAAYRVVTNEQHLAQHALATSEVARAAETALLTTQQFESALHAYVAPGQGVDSWRTRARQLLDTLRTSLLELDTAASSAGASMAESLDACDRLTAAEQRSYRYVSEEQTLLAGEVIFTEARDLLEAMRAQIGRTREQLASAAGATERDIRREQTFLYAGGAGVLTLALLLLLPAGRVSAPAVASVAAPDVVDTPTPPVVREPVATPIPAPAPPSVDTGALATLCSDLASVAASEQIVPLLERARALLDARGVIVWVGTADRAELHPAAAVGYDERLVARFETIATADSNITALAFRDNTPRASVASGTTPAALAVPLPAPGGPAGVVSAELAPSAVMDDAKLHAARVIAAQLGAVLGTTSTPRDEAADAAATAAAQASS